MATTETGLEVRRVPLDSLHQDPSNARAHDARNLDAIRASLQRFAQVEPLVVLKGGGRVIGGNGRLEAMRSLGWSECDVVELELSEVEATALGIALNRTGELAEWDEDTLGRLLSTLRDEGALDGVGFDEGEIDELLDGLLDDLDTSEVDDPGPGELQEEAITQPGDLWVLGRHKLLCGSATEESSLTALLDEERIDLVWTDPPYGVSYEGGTEDALTIQNDDLQGAELEAFLRGAFTCVLAASKPGAVWYVAAPAGPNFLPFAQVLTDLGVWRQTLVWLKDAFVLGRSDFHYRHEALFYGWTPGAAHQAPPSRQHDTVWEVPRPRVSKEHPTMKPLGLVERAIELSAPRGGLVLDPFSGSGTTILAAESKGRCARGIELDPRYCDVIVRRWQDATGGVATLKETGMSFQDVEANQ